MTEKDSNGLRFYKKMKDKSKGWKWKGKLSLHLFFISLIGFCGFFGEYVRNNLSYPYNNIGIILQYSMFIQFLLYFDFKKTLAFNSIIYSIKKEKAKTLFDRLENIKYHIKTKICDTDSDQVNQSNIDFVFYTYSLLSLILTLLAMDKVFTFFNQPSLIHLLKILL